VIVWLIVPGEPTKLDPGKPRLLRTGILSEYLYQRGHRIVFWTTTENHVTKQNRAECSQKVQLNGRYAIWLLHGPLYKKNVSMARIRHNIVSSREFRKAAAGEQRPDVILCCYPTLELCQAAIDYAKSRSVPIVIDVRDMWPDIFPEVAPKRLRWAARLLLAPMFRQSRNIFRKADAITGITEAAVRWAARRGGVSDDAPRNQAFTMAYSPNPPDPADRARAEEFWERRGIPAGRHQFVACFFGQLSRRYELNSVVKAAAILAQRGQDRIRICLCGTGEAAEELKRRAAGLPHIDFPGWMDKAQIWTLLRRSAVGLLPYPSTPDYVLSYPNKAGEYLSAGLPIISSVQGEMQHLLETWRCGLTYPNENAVELADILARLAGAPDEVAEMSRNGLAVFERFFNADRVYAEFADYIESFDRNNSAIKSRTARGN
jgi:glycosyltransferase involved in cell wall biosynthesis